MPSGVGQALFLAQNLYDIATLSASSSSTPVTHLQNPRPTRRWFAADKDEEYVQADFGDAKLVQHFAYVGFNTDTQSRGSCVVANDALFASPVANTGEFDMWEPQFGMGDDPLGETLGGFPILDEFNDHRAIRFADLGAIHSVRYARQYLKNPTNAAIGQVGFGWAFAGVGFQPEWSFDYNWSEVFDDPSEIIETETSDFVRARKSRQIINLRLTDMSTAEALGGWRTIMRAIGKKKTLGLVLFPDGPEPMRAAFTVYGRIIDQPGTANTIADLFESGLTIKELPT